MTHRPPHHDDALPRPRRLLALLVLPAALLLSSCSSGPQDVVPTPVLEQTDDKPYGETAVVQQNLRDSLDLAVAGYEQEKTLALDSDYFNTRHQDISFSEDWPTSLGLLMLHLVSVSGSEDRLLLASKDVSGVCWYIEVAPGEDELSVRYGASLDASCIASKADENQPAWEELDFPLSAPSPTGVGEQSTGAQPGQGGTAGPQNPGTPAR